ncbi:hypothetical protein M3Y98_00538800 [Aphelenchoides besseyi]|nr:hypothetical protein M3Y98_00538800 [Aphelenchoides besseyi]
MNQSFLKKAAAIAAAVGVSGYAAHRYNYYKEALRFVSLDPNEAIENLNNAKRVTESIKSLEALYHLNAHECNDAIKHLTDIAWLQLAILGSELWRFNPRYGQTPEYLEDSEKELARIELDRDWKKAFKYYSEAKICSDEDLHCPSWVRKAHPKRLHKLLKVLHQSTESCDYLVKQNIHSTLHKLFYTYRSPEHTAICGIVFNILSNISTSNRECAIAVCNEWLPTLAQMIRANLLYSLNLASYKLPANIYEFVRPDQEQKISMDIVFVHGFRGSLFRTWRQRDDPSNKTIQFWPREWLRLDIKSNVRVLGLDYPSKLLKFGEIMDSVDKRATKFLQSLKECDVGSRPLFFVAHSMGGLLVKKMLLESEELRKRTVGIVFIAVPNRGTPVISAYLNYLRPTDDAKFLRADSVLNRQLHEQFLEIAPEIPLIFSLVELKPSPLFGRRRMIVPPESAVFESGAVYHLDEHHYSICKPADVNSTAYLIIVKAIKEALELVSKGEKINWLRMSSRI